MLDILWSSIRLKYEESEYFLKQMNAHEREPRLYYFYLSAFISSARSLTFHLQKKAKGLKKTEIYEEVRNNLLSDDEGKYFVELRNSLEKEGYPNLIYRQQTGIKHPDREELVWYANQAGNINPSNESNPFEKVYELIKEEWNLSHQFSEESEVYEYQFRWVLLGHPHGYPPDGSIDALAACERFLKKLWRFLIEIRREFEITQ
jgi:hypothetical protein